MKRLALLLLALLLLAAPAAADEVWEKQLGEEITAVATDEYGDRIFVGTESGKLYCYDASGSVVWSRQVTTAGGNQPIGMIVAAGGEGVLLCTSGATNGWYELFDGETGAVIWGRGSTIASRDGDISNTDVSVLCWDSAVLDIKIPSGGSLGTTVARLPFPATHAAIAGDADWFVITKPADSNLYLYSLNLSQDDWIAPVGELGFEHRAAHTITGSPDGALTNYPVEITVIRGAGSSSGSTLYAPDCRADFADIRFTASDGKTQLPYYLESVNGNTAKFYVKIPSIPKSPGTTSIYIYWGHKGTISSESDPTALYLLYDDFEDGVIDTDQWTPYTGTNGVVRETGGYLELLAQNGLAASREARISSVRTFDYPVMVQANVSVISTYGTGTNLRNRFSFLSPSTEAGIFNMGSGVRYYWDAASATPSSLDTYINHTMVFIPSTSFEWVAGSEYTDTKATAVSSLRIVMAAGDGGAGFGHMRIDNISVTKYTPNPPTHGAWGVAEYVVKQIGTKTLDGAIIDIDAPETGDWVAASTTTKTYIIQITDSGFGTVYSADRTGTPYDLDIANNGANLIEGRGILADIFRFDGVQTGTYTAGGPVQHVAIAQKNGLYAAAGSDDGKYYIFSKDESSSWYLLHGSDSLSPVTALAMSWRGETLVVGRSDGHLVAFRSVVEEEEFPGTIRLLVYKDALPYTGARLVIEHGGPDQTWETATAIITDDYGVATAQVRWGEYVRVTVGENELQRVILPNPSQAEYVFRIKGPDPLRTGAQYSSDYDPDTQRIYLHYDDTRGKTHLVQYKIIRSVDNAVVFQREYSTLPVNDYYQIPAGWTNSSYRIQLTASGSPSFTNTWSQWVGADGVASLPADLDSYARMGIAFFLILFVAGLFSYLSGPQGAVVVSMFAGALVLWGWLPLPPTVIALCIVWAFLGLLGRTSGE